jgi:hypothetical protein
MAEAGYLLERAPTPLVFARRGAPCAYRGRLTGLLAAYAALLQVVLLARLPWLERLVGFDRLTVWRGPGV